MSLRLLSVLCRSSSLITTARAIQPVRTFAEDAKDLVTSLDFNSVRNKNKNTYLELLRIYKDRNDKRRRHHVEFIYSALKHMHEFGVERDLEVYKSLIDVLPKGVMVPRNFFQVEFMHYPKQQQCIIDLLEQMEENAVMPDWDMEDQLVNIFGKLGHPVRRYMRMMYWMPKFKNASPWPLPMEVPNDPFELALMAIRRIGTVDPTTEVTVFKTSEVADALEDTWIVSGQSPKQISLLQALPDRSPVYVEGRFRIWIREKAVTYFILRCDGPKKPNGDENFDDVDKLEIPLFSRPENLPKVQPSVHEQDDGTILAYCSTGTSSRDSVLSWIRCLQETNPRLSKLPVVFTLKAPKDDGTPEMIEGTEQENQSRISHESK